MAGHRIDLNNAAVLSEFDDLPVQIRRYRQAECDVADTYLRHDLLRTRRFSPERSGLANAVKHREPYRNEPDFLAQKRESALAIDRTSRRARCQPGGFFSETVPWSRIVDIAKAGPVLEQNAM